MHDGRFTSLEQVVEHYNSGVQKQCYVRRKIIGWKYGKKIKFIYSRKTRVGRFFNSAYRRRVCDRCEVFKSVFNSVRKGQYHKNSLKYKKSTRFYSRSHLKEHHLKIDKNENN